MITRFNSSIAQDTDLPFSPAMKENGEVSRVQEAVPIRMKQPIFKRAQVDREEFILGLLDPSKSTLHLGCSDAPFTEIRIQSGNLLHAKLLERAPHVIGHDISAPHLNLLRQKYPNAAFTQGNVEALGSAFPAVTFDLIIAGEILEHLCNPGKFFDNCKQVLKPDGRLILTVPNAFGFRRWIHNILGVENYHPEHTFYFSENTVSYLAKQCGFELVQSHYYATATNRSVMKEILYFFVEKLPAKIFGNHLLEGLVLELRPQR